jgi:hypothetical protein
MRYHFHIIDGINLLDYRGTLLADEGQARVYADEMMAYVARAKRTEKHKKFIKVTNDSGAEVFRVAVPFEKARTHCSPPDGEPKH